MNAASSPELGLWTSNSRASYVPGGAFTVTCAAMGVAPSGSDTSVAPVSNSSQSPLPTMASQAETSERLSSTCLSTSSTLRTITLSLPRMITVLSPLATTAGARPAAENAALASGAAAGRDVSEKLTAPVVPLEQAASAIAGSSVNSLSCFILPPVVDVWLRGASARGASGV